MTRFRQLLSFAIHAALLALLGSALVACKRDKAKRVEPAAKTAESEAPAPEPEPEAEAQLQRKVPLSAETRAILKEPMRTHAQDMKKLLLAAINLDYATVEATANKVIAEPRVSRPSNMAEESFTASFPKEYIDLEDQLYAAARSLESAAQAEDNKAMATAYLQMAGTCLGCHSVFLEMPAAK